ncbi:MAG: DNA polymerase Y family protein, partial [Geminicoccaceae bacterium]
MGSRVLSLWLPYFTTDRIRHERGLRNNVERPLATVVRENDAALLAALCPLAERAGLQPGMPLEAAKAVAP